MDNKKKKKDHLEDENLAKKKRELFEEVDAYEHSDIKDKVKQEHVDVEDSLELKDMTAKQRRKYNLQKEKEKLSELTFWRKVQYILMYYSWKFIGVVAGIGLVVLIIYRIYVASCPVALDIVLVNDYTNGIFQNNVIALYSYYNEIPDKARFYVDTNYDISPNTTYTSADMSYYTKMYSVMTGDSTNVIICDSPVVDYYAVDGYALEMYHALPEDLYEYYEDRLYKCDGPVEDSDYYAIDMTDMEIMSLLGVHLENPMFMMPGSLSDENREIGYNFLRMAMEIEENGAPDVELQEDTIEESFEQAD